jgi:type I restriction enzyme S subunit
VLRADDLVLALRGKIGAVAKVNQDLEGANLTRGVALLSRSIRYIPDFLQQFISSSASHDLIEKNLNGSALQEIPIASLRRIPIPVPPLPEQHAIATALADADALIAALEGMITKKRDLKQAAMQHLLTGKTRLPGFSGEWEVKRLGDHVSFLKNGTLSRAQLAIDAPVKYLHYGDIHGSTSLWLRPKSAGMPCVDPELVASLDRLKDGDLIFADASEDLEGVGKSIEIADCIETEVVSGLHTIAARFDKEVLADGFKAYLQFMPPFRDHLRSMAAGTKVLATNRKHIGSAKLALPEPPEQIAIAEVLSDMDADLAALEAQAAKARAVKQGMMQELLTGRVRLV